MHYYIYMSTFVTLIQLVVSDFKCGPGIGPRCICNTPTNDTANTSQFVCSGAITSDELYAIGNLITGDGNLLYIHDTTKLDIIKENTFSKATFKKIFIENNVDLKTIDKDAFKSSTRTLTLAVRNNAKLVVSGLYETAARVGNSLTNVEFQKNNINSFDNAFNNDVFKNLADIRLDSQVSVVGQIKLTKQSFAKLPSLTHLSLYNNKLSIVDKTALVIDLSGSKPDIHVSIFLQDSGLTTIEGLMANANKSIGLNLEGNDLTEVPLTCLEIAKHNGVCYLKENKITTCVCDKVYWVKQLLADSTTKNNIQGLTDVTCVGNTKITECPEPVKTTAK